MIAHHFIIPSAILAFSFVFVLQTTAKQNWVKRSERFARDRARIRQTLHLNGTMHLGQICNEFIRRFRYLPKGIERRLRELVNSKDVICTIENGVPYYTLTAQ